MSYAALLFLLSSSFVGFLGFLGVSLPFFLQKQMVDILVQALLSNDLNLELSYFKSCFGGSLLPVFLTLGRSYLPYINKQDFVQKNKYLGKLNQPHISYK
jgi:hypothetical protein